MSEVIWLPCNVDQENTFEIITLPKRQNEILIRLTTQALKISLWEKEILKDKNNIFFEL